MSSCTVSTNAGKVNRVVPQEKITAHTVEAPGRSKVKTACTFSILGFSCCMVKRGGGGAVFLCYENMSEILIVFGLAC